MASAEAVRRKVKDVSATLPIQFSTMDAGFRIPWRRPDSAACCSESSGGLAVAARDAGCTAVMAYW